MAERTPAELRQWAEGLLSGTTPGPWRADDEHGLIPDSCPAWVVSSTNDAVTFLGDVAYLPQSGTDTEAGPHEEADARLIAAAPDLAREVIRLADELSALRATVEGAWDEGWCAGVSRFTQRHLEPSQNPCRAALAPEGGERE